MKIGILGGTFDPIHYGHLLLAEACREQCELDEIRIIPAATPPHKQDQLITSAKQRTQMLNFATAGFPEYVIDPREIKREGVSYTVQTLEEISQEAPAAELFFLMGTDSLVDLPNWKEPDRIAKLAWIVVVNRESEPTLSEAEIVQNLGESIAERVISVTMPGVNFSSSEIRHRVTAGKSIRFMLPRAVELFIQESTLY